MLAALLLNLTQEEERGTILHERKGSLTLRDVEKAGKEIEALLYRTVAPAKTKAKVKRAIERVAEYQALPTVDMPRLGQALEQTQAAIADLQSFMLDMQEPQWMSEIRLVLERLTIMAMQLNDDEEALLLLM